MTPLVVRIEDLQTGTKSQFAFIRSPVRIGRSEINDLPLVHGFVSQWHAVVQFDEAETRYVDLGSTNGSIVNGARIERNVPLVVAAGTEVRIGSLRLTFERRATGEHRAPPPQTQFAIRAATMMRPAVAKPPAAAGAAPAAAAQKPGAAAPKGASAPPPPEKPGPAGAGAAAKPSASTLTGARAPAASAAPSAPPAPSAPAPAGGAAPSPPLLDLAGFDLPPPPALELGPLPPAGALDLGPFAPPPGALDRGPLPPPPPAAEPLSGAASAAVDGALEAAALDLDLLYASYRGSWEHLRAHLAQVLATLDGPSRSAAAARVAERYPAAGQEPQFQELAGLPASARAPAAARPASPALAAPPRPATPAPVARPATPAPASWPAPSAHGGEAQQLLTAFAESYLPASVTIRAPDEMQAFLGRVAESLEAFSRSFIEMRKGYEEFGKQMGVRTVHGEGPLQRSRDPRQLMASLLDPSQQGRAAELQAAFADYMVHQVAILNGVVEGAKAMLRQVSPEAIEADAPQAMWPMKGQALWKTFEERFRGLVEEEDAISDALFGREFGKAYTAIIGQRGAAEEPDDDEDEDEDEKPRGKPPPRRPRR